MSLTNILKSTILGAGLACSLISCGVDEELEKSECNTKAVIYGPWPARDVNVANYPKNRNVPFEDIILSNTNIKGVFTGIPFWFDACDSDADEYSFKVGEQIIGDHIGGFHAGSDGCLVWYHFDTPGMYPMVVSVWKKECSEKKFLASYVIVVSDKNDQ